MNRPDIIIVPLRGGEPLIRGIQLIASLERRSSELPMICFLKIGEINPEMSGYPVPIHQQDKDRIVREKLATTFKKIGKTNLKILLLDEAQYGGSISKNFQIIERAMKKIGYPDSKLGAIAIAEHKLQRRPLFKRLVEEKKIFVIPVEKLVTTDRQQYLLNLIRRGRYSVSIGTSSNTTHRLNLLSRLEKLHKSHKHI